MTTRPLGTVAHKRHLAARFVWQFLLSPLLLSRSLLSPLFLSLLFAPLGVSAQSTVEITSIATLQGNGVASQFDDQEVTTWGVVTGVTADGFYLQDPQGDGDPLTSDGMFAFTYDAPKVTTGECVQVAGEIAEYYAKTELNWISAITPSQACATTEIAPVALPLLRPGDDPVVVLERFEGMVVRLDSLNAFVHGPTKRFAGGEEEIAMLPVQWQRYLGNVHLFHNQAENAGLLYLSDNLGAELPSVHWGDLLRVEEAGLVGVLDYNFGKYQLLPLPDQQINAMASAPQSTGDEVTPTILPPPRTDEYGICSYNLYGLGQGSEQFPDPVDYTEALRRRGQSIATYLAGCTVLALQETGHPQDAQALADVLDNEHGLTYTALALEGAGSYDAEFPLTNSLLVDSTRVTVERVDSITACTPENFGIVPSGECAPGAYPLFDRPPLVAHLLVDGPPEARWDRGQSVWIINNHWKSKSGDETENARLRTAQANAVAERVQEILAVDPDAQIVVAGDLNDFYQGAAVAALQEATGLFHPFDWLSPPDRYTYIFNGTAQVLDHILVTPNMTEQLALVQILHIHADSPAGETHLAHSDHDPVVVRVRPGGVATIGGSVGWGELAVTANDSGGMVAAQATSYASGDFRLWGVPVGNVTLQWRAPSWIVLDAPEYGANVPVETRAGLVMLELPQARHTTAIGGAWVALQTPWLAERLLR